MNRNSTRTFFCALGLGLLLATAGCASAGGGGSDGSADSVYKEDLGRVLVEPLLAARIKVWGKHNINLFRDETTSRTVLWESEWIPRAPTLDEAAGTVTGARNRVIMRGYQTGENMDRTYIYRMSFEVENQVQSTMFPDWHPAPMPRETRNEFRRVYSDLELELRAGIIR